ncbi:WD repeat, SAM and U-box domain-containing protein 1-like isoform X2 [Corticium candelabrum]|uniref:WD repeat, SAM and U-box domain-containing protein 1-like isoform X2 n=1 Tax=Corticium candelabrum TaxID=121492 RepID=UPI002E25613C|nr:WD repeat, SAM and U-box domain-containing protein 1-like isoform X2 [Corticium candelabrum]
MLQPVAVVSAHKGDVNCCCFSPNGKLIATASGDHTVRLFESSNGREVDQSPLRGHQFYVNVCVFSPDGRILASGSTDGKVKLWSTETCKEIGTLDVHISGVRSAAFSADGYHLAAGSSAGVLKVYKVSSRRMYRSLFAKETSIVALSYSPNGFLLASGSGSGEIRLWDPYAGLSLTSTEADDLCVSTCVFSPHHTSNVEQQEDGTYKLTHRFVLASGGQDHTVKLWNVVNIEGETSILHWQTLSGHSGPVYSVCFSPDRLYLASGSGDKTVTLWDMGYRTAVCTMGDHTRYVTTVAFSPNGKGLATGSNDKTLRIWKVVDPSSVAASEEEPALIVGECRMAKLLSERGIKPKCPLGGWSVDDVGEWLRKIGLREFEQTFRDNAIDGTELLGLDAQMLADDLGITALGHRNKILRAIRELYSSATTNNGVPEEFLCPISMEVMQDPVIASDGYSYERSSILAWLGEGKQTSPMTNLPLASSSLTSNRQLKMLIERHLSVSNQQQKEQTSDET